MKHLGKVLLSCLLAVTSLIGLSGIKNTILSATENSDSTASDSTASDSTASDSTASDSSSEEQEAKTVTDTITLASTGVSRTSSLADFSGIAGNSGCVYAGRIKSDGAEGIVISNSKKNGIIVTSSIGYAQSVTVSWKEATASTCKMEIYGSDTPFSTGFDLNNYDVVAEIDAMDTSTYTFASNYPYIAFCGTGSTSIYLTSISIIWKNAKYYVEELSTKARITYNYDSVGNAFSKITEDQEDWTGTYLIVTEKSNSVNYIFDGSRNNTDNNIINDANNFYTLSESIENNSIPYSDELYAMTFNIEKEDNNYYIKSHSGFYIGNNSSSNGITSNSNSNYVNSITYNTDSNDITIKTTYTATTSKQYTYYLSYYGNTSNKYAYYSTERKVQLYKFGGYSSTYSDIKLHIGGLMEKQMFDLVANKSKYGVAVASISNYADENKLEEAIKGSEKPANISKVEEDPSTIHSCDANGAEDAEGTYMIWSGRLSISGENNAEEAYSKEYIAVAYILTTSGDYIFFNSKTFSLKSVAKQYQSTDYYNTRSDAGKASLDYLATYGD